MTDINNLIHLNLELEGLLRVLVERKSLHAKSLLAQKYREYAAELEAFLAEPDEQHADALEESASALAAEATHTEVKDQEAESAEVEDETDAATAAIERGQSEFAPAAQAEVNEIFATEAENIVPEAPAPQSAEPVALAPEEPSIIATSAPRTPNQKILKAFTLNDKFRFRRNVFGGDDRAFDDTLAILADMTSYDEACDFIYNDMMLDPNNADVADFMAILADCYR